MVSLYISDGGNRFWIVNHQYHRANGPAVVYNGDQEWWWYDLPVTEYEHMILVAQEVTNG